MDDKKITCCKRGSEYIHWYENEFYWNNEGSTTYWAGWGMLVDAHHYCDDCDDVIRPITTCPFCGTKIEENGNG